MSPKIFDMSKLFWTDQNFMDEVQKGYSEVESLIKTFWTCLKQLKRILNNFGPIEGQGIYPFLDRFLYQLTII